MLSQYALFVLLLDFVPCLAAEQQLVLKKPPSPFTQQFEQLVNEKLDLWHVPGVSIAVVDGNDLWAEGYGIASFPDTKVTPSTLFYAGSTTKAFTAAAVSLLIDNSSSYSNIQWNTPISHLIRDDFVLQDDYLTTHITIEDALSHRTGMPRHDISYGGNYGDDLHKGTPKDLVRSLRYLPTTAEPRTKYQYCNMMFVTAAHVVETLTGMWLGDFLKENIWGPLGMKSTYFSTPAAQNGPEPLAQGYVYYKEKFLEVPFMDLDIVSGAGSVISNVLDYSKWLKALLTSSAPLTKKGYKALKKPRTVLPPEDNMPYTGPMAYALGWNVGVYKGYEFFTHSGGMEAFSALVYFFPALNYGLVALANTAVTGYFVEANMIFHLIDEKLEVPESERFNWDKKFKDALKERDNKYENARKIYYPDIPDPSLPLSLPLQSYAGTYYHPGYQNFTVVHQNGRLHVNKLDVTWPLVLDLKHVSGDYFIAHMDSINAPGFVFREAIAAEFFIGADGVSKRFGIAAEPEMGPKGRIWFERI